MQDFDVILGMDWLEKYRAIIDCESGVAKFKLGDRLVVEYHGSKPSALYKMIFIMKAVRLMKKICCVCLSYVVDTYIVEPQLKDVLVVRKFSDVFSRDLPGLPPQMEVEFAMELVPGFEPISKPPYRMTPDEPKELKE